MWLAGDGYDVRRGFCNDVGANNADFREINEVLMTAPAAGMHGNKAGDK